MKLNLKTSLQISALFPLLLAIITVSGILYGSTSFRNIIFCTSIAIVALILTGITMYIVRDSVNRLSILNKWLDSINQNNIDLPLNIRNSYDEIGELTITLRKAIDQLKNNIKTLKQQYAKQEETISNLKQSQVKLSEALVKLQRAQKEMLKQERLKALEQIVYGVIHDLNNTLTPILGTTDLILCFPETFNNPDEMKKHIELIHEAAIQAKNNMEKLIHFFGWKENGKYKENVNISSIINDTIEIINALIKRSGQHIDIKCQISSLPEIPGNPVELRDALSAVCINSVEAMPKGGELKIKAFNEENNIIIEIKDTGIGMEEEILEHCLEPFFSTKDKEGSGLGLTFAQAIVHKHKGRLKIDSKPGVGTTVRFILPSWRIVTAPERKKQPAYDKLAGYKVLVIDDELWSREIVKKLLSCRGIIVDTASGGKEGIEKCKTNKYDIFIVDKAMPDMDGFEVTDNIKNIYPESPIIMLTGFGELLLKEGKIPSNINKVVVKPVDSEELLECIHNVILGKNPESELEKCS